MTEAELAAVRDPGGAVSTGHTLAGLTSCRSCRALAGTLRAIDSGPLTPAPLGALVTTHTVCCRLTGPASLQPAGESKLNLKLVPTLGN